MLKNNQFLDLVKNEKNTTTKTNKKNSIKFSLKDISKLDKDIERSNHTDAKHSNKYKKYKNNNENDEDENEVQYRDRANERRSNIMNNEEYEAPIDEELYSSLTTEETKLLGGDIQHTHLVKGLDYMLLQKMRRDAQKKQEEQDLKESVTTDSNHIEAMLQDNLDNNSVNIFIKEHPFDAEHPTNSRLGSNMRQLLRSNILPTHIDRACLDEETKTNSSHLKIANSVMNKAVTKTFQNMKYVFALHGNEALVRDAVPTTAIVAQQASSDITTSQFQDGDSLVSAFLQQGLLTRVLNSLSKKKKKLKNNYAVHLDKQCINDHKSLSSSANSNDTIHKASNINSKEIEKVNIFDDEEDLVAYTPTIHNHMEKKLSHHDGDVDMKDTANHMPLKAMSNIFKQHSQQLVKSETLEGMINKPKLNSIIATVMQHHQPSECISKSLMNANRNIENDGNESDASVNSIDIDVDPLPLDSNAFQKQDHSKHKSDRDVFNLSSISHINRGDAFNDLYNTQKLSSLNDLDALNRVSIVLVCIDISIN